MVSSIGNTGNEFLKTMLFGNNYGGNITDLSLLTQQSNYTKDLSNLANRMSSEASGYAASSQTWCYNNVSDIWNKAAFAIPRKIKFNLDGYKWDESKWIKVNLK
jgi:hypothetical protein